MLIVGLKDEKNKTQMVVFGGGDEIQNCCL